MEYRIRLVYFLAVHLSEIFGAKNYGAKELHGSLEGYEGLAILKCTHTPLSAGEVTEAPKFDRETCMKFTGIRLPYKRTYEIKNVEKRNGFTPAMVVLRFDADVVPIEFQALKVTVDEETNDCGYFKRDRMGKYNELECNKMQTGKKVTILFEGSGHLSATINILQFSISGINPLNLRNSKCKFTDAGDNINSTPTCNQAFDDKAIYYNPYRKDEFNKEKSNCFNITGALTGWFQVDLGKRTCVSSVHIQGTTIDISKKDELPSDYQVQVSSDEDGNNYVTCGAQKQPFPVNEERSILEGDIECDRPIVGRYVRLSALINDPTKKLAICDIKIFKCGGSPINLKKLGRNSCSQTGVGSIAHQGTNIGDLRCFRAYDGNIYPSNANYYHVHDGLYCSTTHYHQNPAEQWNSHWQIDLGKRFCIGGISMLTNVGHESDDRLRHIRVEVANKKQPTDSDFETCLEAAEFPGNTEWQVFQCAKPVAGRVVRIRGYAVQSLKMCGLKVAQCAFARYDSIDLQTDLSQLSKYKVLNLDVFGCKASCDNDPGCQAFAGYTAKDTNKKPVCEQYWRRITDFQAKVEAKASFFFQKQDITMERCKAGRTGPNCTEACPPFKYGRSCRRMCACKGNGECHAQSGQCLGNGPCKDGFAGQACSLCLHGKTCAEGQIRIRGVALKTRNGIAQLSWQTNWIDRQRISYNYMVRCNATRCGRDQAQQKTIEDRTKETSDSIRKEDVPGNSECYISISAYAEEQEVEKYNEKVKTEPVPPYTKMSMKVISEYNKMLVTWESLSCIKENGPFKNYKLTWRLVNDESRPFTKDIKDKSIHRFTISDNLATGTTYNVTLALENTAGEGPKAWQAITVISGKATGETLDMEKQSQGIFNKSNWFLWAILGGIILLIIIVVIACVIRSRQNRRQEDQGQIQGAFRGPGRRKRNKMTENPYYSELNANTMQPDKKQYNENKTVELDDSSPAYRNPAYLFKNDNDESETVNTPTRACTSTYR